MNYRKELGFVAPRLLCAVLALGALSACGTLTGLPAHGGGKRFATEQRLVSASIRSALMDIDVSALKGKRAALIFDLVADEGGGSFSGGRWSPGLLFSVGTMSSPVTTATNAFQVYKLADIGSNYNNSASGGGSTSISTTLQNGSSTNASAGSSTNASNTSGTNTSTASGTNTSSGSNTSTNTTNNAGSSSGSSTSTTGSTATNTNFNQTDNSTNTTTGSGTNTSSGSTSSTENGSSSNASTGSGTTTNSGSGSNNSNATTISSSSNKGTNRNTGGYNTQRETLSPSPSETVTQTRGSHRDATATLAYRGLGEYQNFPVPKSDASLLMGLVRNYMLLSGVTPTTPNDPTAEVLVYVTVDIFGTVRSRFDAILYNNETVKAETSFEIMAFDREGKNMLKPQVANSEAQYREHYLLWAGPLTTNEKVYQGQGLLVDFSNFDGSTANRNTASPVRRTFWGGKN